MVGLLSVPLHLGQEGRGGYQSENGTEGQNISSAELFSRTWKVGKLLLWSEENGRRIGDRRAICSLQLDCGAASYVEAIAEVDLGVLVRE